MRSNLIPYITVQGAARAIDFYKAAFGASESGARFTDSSGRVGHAEIEIGGARLMLSDEHPELGVLSPPTLGGSPLTLYLSVADAASVVANAAAAGARVEQPVTQQPYGDLSGTIRDPFGHRWMISTPVREMSKAEMEQAFGGAYKVS
jgi:PhnB protein